jgi:hypothetical protein
MPEYLVAHEQPNDNDPSVETETMATVKASERRRKDNSRMSTPRKAMKTTIWIMAPVLAISIGFLVPNAAAQPDPYPKMAPVDQYLMEEKTEIQLARSAAPDSISRDATILVLRRQGYETAVEGKNGFVCMVGRGWTGMFDWPEFWSPQAACSIMPIIYLRAGMVMAGRSKEEMVSAVKAAFEKKQLPSLESGAMDYMMSKSSYLTDQGGHNVPHVMFYTRDENAEDWGSGAAGSPIMSSPYWFISQKEESQMKRLPPILVFLVMVADWSDGTPATEHHD